MSFLRKKSKSVKKASLADRANAVQSGAHRLKRIGQIGSVITVAAVIAGLIVYLLELQGDQKYYAYAFGLAVGIGVGISLEREIENMFTYWLELIYLEGWKVFKSFNWWAITLGVGFAVSLSVFLSIQGNNEIAAGATHYTPTDVGSVATKMLSSFGLSSDTANTLSSEVAAINSRFDALLSKNNTVVKRLKYKVKAGTASVREQNDYTWLSAGYIAKLERQRQKAIERAKAQSAAIEKEKKEQRLAAAGALSNVLKSVENADNERKAALAAKEAKYNSFLNYIIFLFLAVTIFSMIIAASTEKKSIKAKPAANRVKTAIAPKQNNNIPVLPNKNTPLVSEPLEDEIILSSDNHKNVPFSVDTATAKRFYVNPSISYEEFVKVRKAARTAFDRKAYSVMQKHIDRLESAGYLVEILEDKLQVDRYAKPSLIA